MRRWSWVVVALGLTAGCGGSSTQAQSLPPAPSLSASPSAVASAVPAATASLTPEQQVLAAVRAYYAAVNTAGDTGDVAPLAALSTPDCDCRKLVKAIADAYASGTRIIGAVDTLLSPHVARIAPPGAVVEGRLRVSEHQLVLKDGTTKNEPADEFGIEILLGKKASQWLILSVRDAR